MATPPETPNEPRPKGKSFWSRVEAAGDTMETGMRAFLGILFALFFASTAGGLAGQVWVGLGVIFAIGAFPIGFLIGFFWLEVKFALQLLLRCILPW